MCPPPGGDSRLLPHIGTRLPAFASLSGEGWTSAALHPIQAVAPVQMTTSVRVLLPVLAVMLVPPFLGMISSFLVIDALDWLDEPRALYLPGAASAFGIFLMRQFIASTVPRSLIEAARLAGFNGFGVGENFCHFDLGPARRWRYDAERHIIPW